MKYLRKYNSLNSFNGERPFLYALSNIATPTVCGVKNNSSVINEIKYINTDVPNECPIFIKLDHGNIPSNTGFYMYIVWPKLNVTINGTLSIYVLSTSSNPPRKYYYRTNGSPTDCTASFSFSLQDDGYTLEDGNIPWDLYESGDVVKDFNGNEPWMFTSTSYQNMQIEVDITAQYYDEGANDWFNIPVVVYSEKDL